MIKRLIKGPVQPSVLSGVVCEHPTFGQKDASKIRDFHDLSMYRQELTLIVENSCMEVERCNCKNSSDGRVFSRLLSLSPIGFLTNMECF